MATREALPDLVRREKLNGEQSLNKSLEAGHNAVAKISELVGDSKAHLAMLGRVERDLDIDRLASRTSFLPKMGEGADSVAHDQRVIAESVARNAYTQRIASFTSDDWMDELADCVSSDPSSSPALAKLNLMGQHLKTRTDPESLQLRAALSSAKSAIADKWGERKRTLDMI